MSKCGIYPSLLARTDIFAVSCDNLHVFFNYNDKNWYLVLDTRRENMTIQIDKYQAEKLYKKFRI